MKVRRTIVQAAVELIGLLLLMLPSTDVGRMLPWPAVVASLVVGAITCTVMAYLRDRRYAALIGFGAMWSAVAWLAALDYVDNLPDEVWLAIMLMMSGQIFAKLRARPEDHR